MTDVGAVVVTHKRADLALRCCSALAEDVPPEAIVVVVNSPSACHPDDLEALRQIGCRLVSNDGARGYGANINEGARVLGDHFRHFVFLNDDVTPAPGAVGRLVRILDTHASAAIAGGRLVAPDGRTQAYAFRFPSLASEALTAAMLPARLHAALRRRFVLAPVADRPIRVDYVAGAAMAVRADRFLNVGGFDDDFFLYSEDLDLAYRLRVQGWETYACPDAVFHHVGGASTAGRRYELISALSLWTFLRKHWSPVRLAILVAVLAVVFVWNAFYVFLRVLTAPRSIRAKLRYLADQFNATALSGLILSRNAHRVRGEECVAR